ncbi:glycosyltransferase [Silvibacterium acidisoli]|uniref:glycosyltransferase n=1 Tax=Acidobacteriaceae bacterium ZG23-2 TaxID=2883246 RepID=UPI00406C479F
MKVPPPRVAYFPDSFHEINGVAHTSRHFEAFARRRNLPFLCVRAGDRMPRVVTEGNLTTLELRRGFLSIGLDKDLTFDAGFARHLRRIVRALKAFRPDIIHITGPSENGMLAAILANHFSLPMAASWHTNVHEYAARRADWLLKLIPRNRKSAAEDGIERLALMGSAKFYSLARILFAPNPQLCALLEEEAHRPCYLMQRGVDTELFSPEKRIRDRDDHEFVLGFVGRLSIEKNVALLADVHRGLLARGFTNFRFLIVGQGAEEAWLRERLPGAEFTGVLRGEALARAYANMDLFVFPSHTDTFGNVVLEALASGVPAIVTRDGGPASIVRDGVTGCVSEDENFALAVEGILNCPEVHAAMRRAAREDALKASWDAVFERVYEGYAAVL